jgi:deoxyribose-phosphate aldolase
MDERPQAARIRALIDELASLVSLAPGAPADGPLAARPVTADASLARRIDHTLLKADATVADLRRLCDEALAHGFATVCVNSGNVARCAAWLSGSTVGVCTVVGFPLGASSPEAKAFEARTAVRDGAAEIDTVINVGALKSMELDRVLADLRGVVEAAAPVPVKVILETSMLSDREKVAGCVLSLLAGARFVKTSTGFGGGGATVEDVALMRRVVGDAMQVKASGGIRTREDAVRMIAAGADRLGTSAGVAIVGGSPGGSAAGY